MSQNRSWCFTLNNPEPGELDELQDFQHTRYLVYQLECAPTTGTLHYQAYVEFHQPVRFNALKRLIPRANIRARRGTRDEARNYCMKDDTRVEPPVEYGEWIKGRGHRTDLQKVAELVQSKVPLREIVDEHPLEYIKFHKGIEKLMSFYKPEKLIPYVVVLYGKPGSGKTRLVFDNFDDVYTVPDTASFVHFTGYTDQYVALFDDYYGQIKCDQLLRLLDRYPYDVNTKGGTTYWNPGLIVLTSNTHPSTWYRSETETEALIRRIDKIYEI